MADNNQANANGKKLMLPELERFLWESANILRGRIDSSDYKNYIFGLLFLKRISDVFEEEAEEIEKETGDKELAWGDPDEHEFFVPPRSRWPHLRKITQDIGETINKANEALEETNPELEGVLVAVDFNNKDRLPDRTLSRLLDHFSTYRLRNGDLYEPDILGRAYEYLIKQFADDAGKKGGEFYTPQKVVQLVVQLVQPQEGMRVCDPCCGSGGMLIEAAKYVESQGGNLKNISLFGQENNLGTWAICKMNMLLHGIMDSRIEKGDTMLEPKFLDAGELMLFDRVIANPMWSQKGYGPKTFPDGDPYGRFVYGMAPAQYADWAWIQHMLATLNINGKMGIVLDNGVLFRGNSEGKIRKQVVEADLVEAVIALPAKLFYNTGSAGCIIVLNRSKPKERKDKVIFIYGGNDYLEGKAQNFLRDEDVAKHVAAFNDFKNIERYCRVVDLEEIRKNDYNLNITRYVDIVEPEEPVDVASVVKGLENLEAERAKIDTTMKNYLRELGYRG